MKSYFKLYLKKKTSPKGDVYWYAEHRYKVRGEGGKLVAKSKYYKLGLPPNTPYQTAKRTKERFEQRLAVHDDLKAQIDKASTLGQMVVAFMNEKEEERKRKSTIRMYALWLTYFNEMYGVKTVREITARDAAEFRAHLMKKKSMSTGKQLSPATVNVALRCMKALFRYAVKQEIIPESPFAYIKLLPPTKRNNFWTQEQYGRFRKWVDDYRLRAGFDLAFYAGLRLGEAMNLRWDDVHIDGLGLDECPSLMVVSREGAPTKSGEDRRLPVHDYLADSLRTWRKLQSQLKGRYEAGRRSDYVLSRTMGPADPWLFSKRFTHILRSVNRGTLKKLPIITFHGLRHSFATNISDKIHITQLQDLMGHADISTTMIYVKRRNNEAVAAATEVFKKDVKPAGKGVLEELEDMFG